jgi:hypothetical protein
MSWDTEYLLEGLTTFGAPLNIWEWEVYDQPTGYQPLDYHRLHMRMDNDPALFSTLMGKMKNGGSITYYPRLIVMRVMKENRPGRDYCFYNAWLYSLETKYRRSTYPFPTWEGVILGIAFDKTKANIGVLKSLGNRG